MPKAHATPEPVVHVSSTEIPSAAALEAGTVEVKADHATTDSIVSTTAVKATLTAEARQLEADKIVMKATYTSLGIGFIPVPVIDIIAISGFQMKMIAELSELHGVKFSEHTARNIITSLVGSLGPVILGQFAGRTLLKFIPGVGSAIASLWMQGIIDGAATYGIGRVFQNHFEHGGTLLDLDLKTAKDYFLIKFKEGKTIVAKSVSNATTAAAGTFRSKEAPATVTVVPA